MHRSHHHWWSPSLGQDMELIVYGDQGRPVVVFPTSAGRHADFENFGMVDACRDVIESGKVSLITVDSIDNQSWENFSASARDRACRHEAYEAYVLRELLPFVSPRLPDGLPIAAGCSMGAYHAANLFLRHPDVFGGCISLSGLYRLDRQDFRLGPQDMAEVYFHSPIHYLPGLQDSWYLERIRRGTIMLCAGQGAWEGPAVEDSRELAAILQSKGVPCWLDLWGFDVSHDWPWWRKQMPYFLDKLTI